MACSYDVIISCFRCESLLWRGGKKSKIFWRGGLKYYYNTSGNISQTITTEGQKP